MVEWREERLQLFPGFVGIPESEELEEGPLDALNALLLPLCSILCAEGKRVDVWPVGMEVKVEQSKARKE